MLVYCPHVNSVNRGIGGGDMEKTFELIPSLSVPSQRLVKALVKQLCENEGINVPLTPALGLQTLAEGIPMWEASLVGSYSPQSIRLYKHYVTHLLVDDPAPTSLSIQSHLADRLLNNASPAAVRNELKALRNFFTYLHEQGLWYQDATRGVKAPKLAEREVKAPSANEVAKILSAIDMPKLKVMIVLASDSGFRYGELAPLTWDQVDFENAEATVIGKGNKERTVPLSPISLAALESIKRISDGTNLVFPSKSIEGWDNRDANRSLAKFCKKAGVKKYTCHQFRHFFATYSLRDGADLKSISEILGHADVSTTLKYYYHTDKAMVRREHDRHSPFSQLLLTEGDKE